MLTGFWKLSEVILEAVGGETVLLQDTVTLQEASFELSKEWFADSAMGAIR